MDKATGVALLDPSDPSSANTIVFISISSSGRAFKNRNL